MGETRKLTVELPVARENASLMHLEPRGLSLSMAAAYVGVSATTFDNLVRAQHMPKPVKVPGARRMLWDRRALDRALDLLFGAAEDAPADEIEFA